MKTRFLKSPAEAEELNQYKTENGNKRATRKNTRMPVRIFQFNPNKVVVAVVVVVTFIGMVSFFFSAWDSFSETLNSTESNRLSPNRLYLSER